MAHEELFNYVVLYVFFELVDAIRMFVKLFMKWSSDFKVDILACVATKAINFVSDDVNTY